AIAHDLQRPDQPIAREIVRAFGPQILGAEGAIDRSRLGRIVFSDPQKRTLLEEIMHPAIRAREEELMGQWERSGAVKVVMVEEALLIETGSLRRFHRILLVVASGEIQLQRLLKNGLSEGEARSRIAAQMPLWDKVKYADYLIDNSGTRADTERQVGELYPVLLEEAKRMESRETPL
ncbi:MAG: dephospho-CoA kinase, partial [candidate division NC10 bacterium]|nr:dephospho-CoA kinase [candidate division NC10 bacterium]